MVRAAAAGLSALVFVGASAGTAAAAPQTFTPEADAYVIASKQSRNFGSANELRVDASPVTRSYARFHVQGVTGIVTQATLRLRSTTSSSVGYDVRTVADNSWGESTIKYSNAPPVSAGTIGSSGPFGSGQWVGVDVTQQITGNGFFSFGLTTTTKAAMAVASREYGSGFAPQLVIEASTQATPPANTAPPTISGTTQEGHTLTAQPGSWTGTQPISYAYRWRRCDSAGGSCVDIAGATSQTYTLAAADVGATLRVAVTASNSAGSSAASSAQTAVITPAPADPILVGAGDIAGTPQGASGGDEATAKLLDSIVTANPGRVTVFTAGDNAYPNGTTTEFNLYYDPTWGRHKSITRPSPGNHDYNTSGATGYYGYFGSAAGDPTKGYYAYNLGAWRIYSLNSEIAHGTGSVQEQWLRTDLAANPSVACVLAYWHRPRFSSGTHGSDPGVQPLYQALYDHGADVVVVGHDHNYQRFAPQNPTGGLDTARGIRQFVAGAGGISHYTFNTPIANTEAYNTDTYGVLKLTLHATSYDFQFVPEAGRTFSDSGSGVACH